MRRASARTGRSPALSPVDGTDDAEVIVVEYELTGTVTTTGKRSSVTCIAILRVRNGLIKHWREYQDIRQSPKR